MDHLKITYGEQGVNSDQSGKYLRQEGKAKVLMQSTHYTDTLVLNSQGYVAACYSSKAFGITRPKCTYTYDKEGYLIKEELDLLYFAHEESYHKVTVYHTYQAGNRVSSLFEVRSPSTQHLYRTATAEYTFLDERTANSNLPVTEQDVVHYWHFGDLFDLEKKHFSLYGKPNKNLVKETRISLQGMALQYQYHHSYTFNHKNQVESMYMYRRSGNRVKGIYQRYKYLD